MDGYTRVIDIENVKTKRYDSPAGELLIGSYEDRLCLCDWVRNPRRERIDRVMKLELRAEYEEGTSEVIETTVCQLTEYFAGERQEFALPLLFMGTEFQGCVWEELLEIPYGEMISYSELARRLGKPRGVRAVAGAVALNPMSIIVPCHRVVGADGHLAGYAGGLDAKRSLLGLEARIKGTALPL